MRWILVALVGCSWMAPCALAHPGDLDTCGGHATQEQVEYPQSVDGTTPVLSESGEYHFHFTKEQLEREIFVSLRDYRLTHPDLNPPDYGSFLVGERAYDILEYTRQQEVIIRCVEPEGTEHVGIVRGRAGW